LGCGEMEAGGLNLGGKSGSGGTRADWGVRPTWAGATAADGTGRGYVRSG